MGSRAMFTDKASSSQRCDCVQNRKTSPNAAAAPMAIHPASNHRRRSSFVEATAGSALGAVAWVFVTATARNGSLRTYCGPIIRRAHPTFEQERADRDGRQRDRQ